MLCVRTYALKLSVETGYKGVRVLKIYTPTPLIFPSLLAMLGDRWYFDKGLPDQKISKM
ncbi:asl1676 [Nostoc sp. PCC 7120 = FACHB-418]|nr:asl1676 [Nostoc sp. PCC 7120 = FACHB-418]